MSMRWPAAIILVTLGLFLIPGCGSRPDRSGELSRVRSLHVTPSISGSLSDASFRLEPALQDAVTRSLIARGFSVGPEADAEGLVRVAWVLGRDIAPNGQDERTLSLSLSIFSRSGDRLYSARSLQTWPERMWSEDRVSSEIARMIRDLPPAEKTTTSAPAETKPKLAPIRLR